MIIQRWIQTRILYFQYSCGHSCTSFCHKGPCPGSANCKKKVRIYCKCKQRKIDFSCDILQSEKIISIPCDSTCEIKKQLEQEEIIKEKRRLEEIENVRNQKEIEMFEKKFGPKKFKERKLKSFDTEPKTNNYKIVAISIVFLAAILSLVFINA